MKAALLIAVVSIWLSCGNTTEKQHQSLNQANDSVTFKVTFDKKYKFYLDYLDSNYKNSLLKYINNKDTFNIISHTVAVQLPTIFSYNTFVDARLLRHDILALPGDTIDIHIINDKINVSFPNPALAYLNKLITPLDIKQLNTNNLPKTNGHELFLTNSKTKEKIDSDINRGVSLLKIPKRYAEAFSTYGTLRYLYETFNIDYPTNTSQLAGVLLDLTQKKETALKDSIFEKITSPDIKMLLYNLIRFENAKKHKKSLNIFQDVQNIDRRLYASKALSGFLLDLLDIESRTALEKKNNLAKIAPYVDPAMFEQSQKINFPPLTDSVLAAFLTNLSGQSISLKEVLSSNKKRLVLLDFWASWCVPCAAELPSLKQAAKKLDRQMQVISISIDQDSSKWQEGCSRYQLLTNSYLIKGGRNSPLISFFAIEAIPRYLLLDEKGRVISADFYRPSDPKFEVSLMETYHSLQ